MELSEIDKNLIQNSIRDVKDFPKEGVVFKDITTLLNNKEALQTLINHLEDRYKSYDLDYICGIDSRGFIFGSILADRLNVGFVPVRKKGKLPSTTVCEKYELEYGYDEVEIHLDAFPKKNPRVLLIDDLIATGGTAAAAAKLIKNVDANLIEACFILNLTFLNGVKKVKEHTPVYSVLDI
ncbi:adenine phosphoribosyltransferase [Halarcobacter anaerophilus]|uniref:Adenine phosphoribosyltransferase n=1 Tax=Halarcobacter anaerophilus TaxID=877500 RepID=A0A4V1LPM4_9BACT|nr:adenine phosphoribosyltransferase [Halarcobacter anaerophilus]QDF28378.1 adenine phosphoribosyltransferase [Halarcobacter anaerophilus]RXJ61708.1 adenine phosphoribosyltransferase [Halarcobacter anaerophilus]